MANKPLSATDRRYLALKAQRDRKKRRYFVIPPTGLVAEQVDADVVVSWDMMPIASSYFVYLYIDDEWVLQDETTETEYIHADADLGTYLFGVIADYYAAGKSDIAEADAVEVA